MFSGRDVEEVMIRMVMLVVVVVVVVSSWRGKVCSLWLGGIRGVIG